MKHIGKTIKRITFVLLLLTSTMACTSEDDIEEIFVDRTWTLTYIKEGATTRYTEGKKYSILFSDNAFTATTPGGNTITGYWQANGDNRTFTCSNVRTNGNISKDTIAQKMRDILVSSKKYEGDTNWLRIKQQENVYMLFGTQQ